MTQSLVSFGQDTNHRQDRYKKRPVYGSIQLAFRLPHKHGPDIEKKELDTPLYTLLLHFKTCFYVSYNILMQV